MKQEQPGICGTLPEQGSLEGGEPFSGQSSGCFARPSQGWDAFVPSQSGLWHPYLSRRGNSIGRHSKGCMDGSALLSSGPVSFHQDQPTAS